MIANLRALAGLTAILVMSLFVASQAQAVPQFTPTATSLLHTVGSGETGAEWNTGGLAVGGSIDYDSGTEVLTITGELDVMHYYDPLNGSCPTDAGSDCTFSYGPNLDITLTAQLSGITVNALGGGFFELLVEFESTGSSPDLTITDPDDGGSLQLAGDIVAGEFGGAATTGLQAQVIYNSGAGTALFDESNSVGFFQVDAGTPYASLFGSTFIGINLGTFSDFSPSLDSLASTAFNTGTLGDFTAEANAQIFRSSTGEFVVPEPSTALLLGAGLGLLGLRRRRS